MTTSDHDLLLERALFGSVVGSDDAGQAIGHNQQSTDHSSPASSQTITDPAVNIQAQQPSNAAAASSVPVNVSTTSQTTIPSSFTQEQREQQQQQQQQQQHHHDVQLHRSYRDTERTSVASLETDDDTLVPPSRENSAVFESVDSTLDTDITSSRRQPKNFKSVCSMLIAQLQQLQAIRLALEKPSNRPAVQREYAKSIERVEQISEFLS